MFSHGVKKSSYVSEHSTRARLTIMKLLALPSALVGFTIIRNPSSPGWFDCKLHATWRFRPHEAKYMLWLFFLRSNTNGHM